MSYYRKSMTDAYREMYPLNEEVELDEAKMSSSQIDRLKKAYEPMRGKKISTDNANKLSAMMNKIGKDKDSLIQLFKADIPFVSQSAATQLISKHGMKGAEINKLREEVEIDEDKPGLWDNIHKKRERGEKMRKKGDPGAPTDAAFKKAQEEVEIDEAMLRGRDYEYDEKEGVVKISKKNFAKVHKDQKGTDKSKPTMMVLTKKGTSLVPVKFTEEVELHELTPDEKKLINQMYDKKGNLTPIGKKVMDHGKKTAGKKEEVEVDEKKVDHQLKIAIDTVKNPNKGKFLGGPSAKEAEKTLRTKYKYTDKMIAKLKEELDEKKKEPVFKGTPAQIKKQMKDWKKKHDKVKIGEEELDEAMLRGRDYEYDEKDSEQTISPNESYEFGTDEYRKYLEDMTPMEGARSDAMKDMKRAGWLKSKDLDKDDIATDDDRKAANKNILVQLKKTFDTEGKSDIVFLDKKKKKVSLDVAKAVLKKYVTFKRSDEKLKFQNKIAKSYKDMLQAIKENAIYDTEDLTILDRIEFKIKEKKNG